MPPETGTDNAPKSESNRPGNPAVVAMRVIDILAVVQPQGESKFAVNAIEGAFETQNLFGETEFDLNGDTLAVKLGFSFRGFIGEVDRDHADEESERDADIAIDGTFIVLYSLEDGEELREEDLRAFSHINGPLNVVPYWREFVSSSFVRAGLPAYTVPVFNPSKIAKDMAEERASSLPEAESSREEEA